MTENEMKRLQAAELHGAMPVEGINVQVGELTTQGPDASIPVSCGPFTGEVILYSRRSLIPTFYLDTEYDVMGMSSQSIDSLIALLQKTKEIMAKGGA